MRSQEELVDGVKGIGVSYLQKYLVTPKNSSFVVSQKVMVILLLLLIDYSPPPIDPYFF